MKFFFLGLAGAAIAGLTMLAPVPGKAASVMGSAVGEGFGVARGLDVVQIQQRWRGGGGGRGWHGGGRGGGGWHGGGRRGWHGGGRWHGGRWHGGGHRWRNRYYGGWGYAPYVGLGLGLGAAWGYPYYYGYDYVPRTYYRGALQPWTPAWYEYCSSRYRSFNPRTGYFTTYSGRKVFCR